VALHLVCALSNIYSVLPIIPYDDLDAAIDEVNAGERPLGLYVYSKDIDGVYCFVIERKLVSDLVS